MSRNLRALAVALIFAVLSSLYGDPMPSWAAAMMYFVVLASDNK